MTPGPGAAVLHVPATSANLGPGFDALGLALDLHLTVKAQRSERDSFRYRGEGSVPETPDNLLHRGFVAACRAAGARPFPVAFEADNPIPMARGLGSSSAALVAGAAAADVLLGEPLGRDGVFEVTAAIEGHPDNVAPAVYGGFTVSARDAAGRFHTRSLPLPAGWKLLFAVPDFEVFTETARGLVPESYSRADVISTSSRAALWAVAVATDEPGLLRAASLDVLHQPYRAPIIPGFLECIDNSFTAGAYAAYLSGAGPAVGVVVGEEVTGPVREALLRYAGPSGRVIEPSTSSGYRTSEVAAVSAGPEAL